MTMRRRVFFAFHYQIDVARVQAIREAWISRDIEETGFWDKQVWETARTRGNDALKAVIAQGLEGTTVTVVLVGPHTWERPWVHYEIDESRRRGNGLLGIRIHKVPSVSTNVLVGGMPQAGINPFEYHVVSGRRLDRGAKRLKPPHDPRDPPLTGVVPLYDWVDDNGARNIGTWIDTAAGRGSLTRIG